MTNAKRDAAWEKYKDENKPNGQAKFYYKDNRQYWCDGYSSRDAEVAALTAQLSEFRLNQPYAGSTDTLTEKYALRRENEALKQQVEKLLENLASNICGYCWDKMHTQGYPSAIDRLEAQLKTKDEAIEVAVKAFTSLEEEIDPRGLDHDVGFISHKGMDIIDEAHDKINTLLGREG